MKLSWHNSKEFLEHVWKCGLTCILKKFKFFYLKFKFLVLLDCFDILISKIILKILKNNLNIFLNKKLF
jgi:hypothetical protein